MKYTTLLLAILLLYACGNRDKKNSAIPLTDADTILRDSIIDEKTIQGDFNGNGRMTSARVIHNNIEECMSGCVQGREYGHILFSDSTIPAIKAEYFIYHLTNEGDLNGDSKDEIGFITQSLSRHVTYNVYTLYKGKWQELVDPIPTYDSWLDDPQFDIISIDPNRSGYVIIQSAEWDQKTEWIVPV